MHSRCRMLLAGALLLAASAIFAGCTNQQTPQANPNPPGQPAAPDNSEQRATIGDYQLSGPYTHDNLTIFLMHGEDRLKSRNYIMLADALEKKQFVIYETQNVNGLTMENLSSSQEVLILSGDILKGGQQDRIAQHDQFVPPNSGKVPLTVFCVEHTAGRWMRKMTQEDKTFTSSPGQLCSNDLRLANRYKGSQGEVWRNVAAAQGNLSSNAGTNVKAKESDSSLALSIQSKEVKAAADRYLAKLATIVEGKTDVVGYAFAINGKLYTADFYGSPALFRKVWPRLINATAIEAFADLQKDKTFPAVTVANVKAFLEEAEKGTAESKEVSKEIRQVTNATAKVVRIETKAGAAQDAMKKDGGDTVRTSILAR